jgi:hypothetical protein
VLSPAAAFEEAGIEIVRAGEPTVVDLSTAGANAAWSDAELHAAMELSFSRWADRPQWAMWLLHADTHEDPEIFGLMFDRRGLQRQGCAVFYQELTPTSAASARALLQVCVHEIGHVFNLPHCWQRMLDDLSFPSRPGALSWMNYPDRFPDGPDDYWRRFAFEFDEPEVVHLRHAFRDSVIMGGDPFAGTRASGRADRWDHEHQDPGLRLKLDAPRALTLGVPVTVGLELSATTSEGRLVPRILGPRPLTVEIAIRDPRGDEFVFQPLLQHCRRQPLVRLRAGDRPIRDHAFIHYGKGGFAFERPGLYTVRGRYTAPDGSLALSNHASIRISSPASGVERDVARLVSGNDDVGALMSLVGSDARGLRDGAQALRTIIDRHPGHPVADIARCVLGTNLAREFKMLAPDGSVTPRDPETARAASLVESVVDVAQMYRARPESIAPGRGPAATMLAPIATRPRVAPAVRAYLNSRRGDLDHAYRSLWNGEQGQRTTRSQPPRQRRAKLAETP